MGIHVMGQAHTPPLADLTDDIRHRVRQSINRGAREVTLPVDDVLALCAESDDLADEASDEDLCDLRESVGELKAALEPFAEIGRRLRILNTASDRETEVWGETLEAGDFMEAAGLLAD